jgi:DNA-binding GntR family transcriptional regulator
MQDILPTLKRSNMSTEVYNVLRKAIISKRFRPGSRLDLRSIAEQVGVSHYPLKEAVNRLALEGLVEVKPRVGTFVTDPSLTELADSFDVRRVLETRAIELAVERMTESELDEIRGLITKLRALVAVEDLGSVYHKYMDMDHELHRRIVECSRNKRLAQILELVNLHVQMARARYGGRNAEIESAQQEHEEILHALEDRNAALAGALMNDHIERAGRMLLQDMRITVSDG